MAPSHPCHPPPQCLPAGQLVEVPFAELDADPLGALRRIYAALSLPSFEEASGHPWLRGGRPGCGREASAAVDTTHLPCAPLALSPPFQVRPIMQAYIESLQLSGFKKNDHRQGRRLCFCIAVLQCCDGTGWRLVTTANRSPASPPQLQAAQPGAAAARAARVGAVLPGFRVLAGGRRGRGGRGGGGSAQRAAPGAQLACMHAALAARICTAVSSSFTAECKMSSKRLQQLVLVAVERWLRDRKRRSGALRLAAQPSHARAHAAVSLISWGSVQWGQRISHREAKRGQRRSRRLPAVVLRGGGGRAYKSFLRLLRHRPTFSTPAAHFCEHTAAPAGSHLRRASNCALGPRKTAPPASALRVAPSVVCTHTCPAPVIERSWDRAAAREHTNTHTCWQLPSLPRPPRALCHGVRLSLWGRRSS